MNEMNSLETQLRSLKPRRPSAGLERRIFIARAMPRAMTWWVGSLAPVAACVALTFMIANSGGNFSGGSQDESPMMAMVLSNQNDAAYAAADSRRGENNWISATFDWTNRGDFTSSIASFPRAH
jgi:hypothetical protein